MQESNNQNTDNNQDYSQATGNTTMYELQGLIPLLNASASRAKTSLYGTLIRKPDVEYARQSVWDFYTYLGAIVMNAIEILDPEIVKQFDSWYDNNFYPDPVRDITHFKRGLLLSKKIQHDLWMKGIKDTNRSQSLPFPCEVYREVGNGE